MPRSAETRGAEAYNGRIERRVATAFVVISVLLFCYSHARGFSISAFSDDIALIRLAAQHANDGTLLHEIYVRLTGPLAVGGTMWRPIPYASFALDAWLYGDATPLWRVANMVLHLVSAASVAWLALQLVPSYTAGAVAFGVFLLQPWAPEVSLWIVGRYDAFATCLTVLTLVFAVKSRGADRYLALSVVTAAFAYASKESASALVALLAIVLLARDAAAKPRTRRWVSRSTTIGLLVHGCVFAIYAVFRHWLFGSISVDVYRSEFSVSVTSLANSVWAYVSMPGSLGALSPLAALTAAITIVIALCLGFARSLSPALAIAGAAMTLAVFAALATVFPSPDGARDGWRVFHLASVGIALVVASAFVLPKNGGRVLVVIALVSLASWQRAAVEEWRVASNAMLLLQSEIKRIGASMSRENYGLLAVPDALGRVPFARNAQGGLLLEYSGDQERISQMIIATDDTIREWRKLSDEAVVKKLTTRSDAPAAPTIFYCFNGRRLVELGFWRSTDQADWDTRWRNALSVNCPGIGYR